LEVQFCHKLIIQGVWVPRHKRTTYKLRFVICLVSEYKILNFRSFQDCSVWVSILLRKNCVTGQICMKFQNEILIVCFHPNIFIFIIIGLSKSQVILFTNIGFCFISCLRFIHNSYEFGLLLAKS
jgi:hypothetical protein